MLEWLSQGLGFVSASLVALIAFAFGAMFVFFGRRRTVLITYPTDRDLKRHLPQETVRVKDRPGLWWP